MKKKRNIRQVTLVLCTTFICDACRDRAAAWTSVAFRKVLKNRTLLLCISSCIYANNTSVREIPTFLLLNS